VNKNSTYRPDIDGLRAVAVLAVLFFHAGLGCTGGFAGVDIFFVISGYLITGLILKDLERGQFQFLEFWARRVRRIFPALLVVVLFSLAAGWFILLPSDFQDLCQSVAAQALLVSNFYFWKHAGYFTGAAQFVPLLHTWSLAVEEQFYLFFPFFLFASRGLSRRTLIFVASSLCFLSLAYSVHISNSHFAANFYLMPSRAWELLIGALPALLSSRLASPQWLKEVVALAGLMAIFYAIIFYDHTTLFPGIAALVPCAGASLLIWANSGGMTLVGKLLALPPLVFVGLISYSLYLWHWPLLVFSRYSTLAPLTISHRLLLLGASLLLAIASWKWIETPFRTRAILKSRVRILSFAGIATAGLILIGLIVDKLQGIPARFSPQVLAYAKGESDIGIRAEVGLGDVRREQFVQLGADPRQSPALFVWGDSHAMAILSMVDALCREHGVAGLAATHSSTAPLLGLASDSPISLHADSIPYNDGVMNFIKKRQIPDVVLVARWSSYGDNPRRLRSYLDETIRSLKEAGARVWIMRDVPRLEMNVPRSLALFVYFGGTNPEGPVFSLDYYHQDAVFQDELFHGISSLGVTMLDPCPLFFNPQGRVIVQENGKPLYFDDHHLSSVGAAKLRNLFEPLFTGGSKSR
jgi:peptidoglycan/LPS O-acetylase OafA/YrhL